jgi:signal transduction histidine kinase
MRTCWSRRALASWLLMLELCVAVCLASPGSAATAQKQVLVLYSTRRDAQIAIVGERELPRIFDEGLKDGVDYYSEYIDRARFPDEHYRQAFREFLRSKYKGQQFDVIIAMQNVVLDFVGSTRDELFPNTPVVYFASPPLAHAIPNSVGVTSPLDFGDTLALAVELQPDVERCFVVSGASPGDKEYENLARSQFESIESRIAVTYLSGLPTRELETRVATLPAHSVIYYLVVNSDGNGDNFHPLEYLDRIAAIANAPIYSWVDSTMGHGIVGGRLKSQTRETEALGRLALRVLGGERADAIPPSSPDLGETQIDWRQIRRWGISEARIPAAALVRFREPTLWDRYKGFIVGTVALLLAQTMLIVGLLVQKTRRRHAEEQARASQAELVRSYDRIRDMGARLLNAQEGERSRIARELHDDISQQLALLSIDLELLSGAAHDQPKHMADEALVRVQDLVRSVHDLSHRLHPSKLRLIGLIPALKGLRRELAVSDIDIVLTDENVPAVLPPDLTLCLFRVVQEALQNAVKYSGARNVLVHLAGRKDALELTIVDDGAGFDVDAAWGKGLGLVSMTERIEAIGGTIEIHSERGAGTRLEIRAPLPLPQETHSVAV